MHSLLVQAAKIRQQYSLIQQATFTLYYFQTYILPIQIDIYIIFGNLIWRMQLYHRSLLQPNTHILAMAVHLDPIKPKQEHEKSRQLLLCKTSAIQLYRCLPSKSGLQRYELKAFHNEDIFSTICAADIIVYQDEDLRQDLLILTLANGKYQLLEWRVQKAQFALTDQKLIFSEEKEVQSGLCKPKVGHYIAVNNEARLVMIASVQWQCKLYSRTVGVQGIRLSQIAHIKGPMQADKPSICLQLSPALGTTTLFYSLRTELKDGMKLAKVYKLKRVQDDFQQECVLLEDSTAHMLVGRSGQGNFFTVGEKYLSFTVKGKLTQLKVPQPKPALQSTWWRRPLRQKKEEYFILNEYGQLVIVNFDDANPNPCSINYVQTLVPSLQGVALQRNLFFLLTATHQNLLLQAVGKYKCQDRIEKTRSSAKLLKQQKDREEQGLAIRGQFREFELVGSMQTGRMIRDLKICNIQKGMNNQILVTGGRPGSKRGFLSIMKHGLKMKEHISINLSNMLGIWPVRRNASDKNHTYIVISFSSRKTITYYHDHDMGKLIPTSDLRLDQNQNTLHVARFGDNSLVQVSPSKLKYFTKEGTVKTVEIRGRISKATSVSQGKQLLLLLYGGYIQYYQVIGGELHFVKELVLDSEVNQIEFAPTELIQGKPYAKMFAVGLSSYHVHLYSIGAQRSLELIVSRNFKSSIESLVLVPQIEGNIFVYIGTNNGKVLKWLLNKNGEPIQLQEHVISEKSIKFAKLTVIGKPSIFRLTPQPYLSYTWQGQPQQCSIPLPNLDQIAQVSLQGVDGALFITYYGGYLRFVELFGFGNLLYTNDKELEYPGRKLLILEERLGVLTQGKVRVEDKDTWISKFIIFNPSKQYTVQKNITFQNNEKVLSLSSLSTKDGKNLLCFGCCIGHTNFPQANTQLTSQFPSVKIYSYQKNENELLVNLLFSHPLDNPPTSMQAYFSQLLVGVGRKLMLYDIYKQKLVVRAVSDTFGSPVCTIHVDGEKIFITQTFQSFSLLKFNPKTKCFDLIGQDFIDRFTTCGCLMDGEGGVVAGGDKFGNFYVSKMSQKMKVQFEEIKESTFEPNTNTFIMESLTGYHIGQIITAIQNGRIDPKKPDCIFYATIDGRIGMFYPLEGQEQTELIQLKKLQAQMTKSSLSGATNHKMFRSQFNPAKGVVDGDLCQLFQNLSEPQKSRMTSVLERESKDITSLLTYMQNKFS